MAYQTLTIELNKIHSPIAIGLRTGTYYSNRVKGRSRGSKYSGLSTDSEHYVITS